MKCCKTVYSNGRKRKAWNKQRGKIFQTKEENICLKQIKDHIITRVNGCKNKKIPDCTFFYGAEHKSKYSYINIKTTHL